MAIEPFIDEDEITSLGFCEEEDRFYRYLAVRGETYLSDECYEADHYDPRMVGFTVNGIHYYFDRMPLLEKGIDHIELPEEVDSPEFRQILKDLFPLIPNFEDILFLQESDEMEAFYEKQLAQEMKEMNGES